MRTILAVMMMKTSMPLLILKKVRSLLSLSLSPFNSL